MIHELPYDIHDANDNEYEEDDGEEEDNDDDNDDDDEVDELSLVPVESKETDYMCWF